MPGMGGSIQRVTDEDRLTGVRGWLLLPPVVVAITILAVALGAIWLAIWGDESGARPTGFLLRLAFFWPGRYRSGRSQ